MDLAKLEFDREFFAYLPRHTSEEHERLEHQLVAEGIADRIRVWATTGGKRNDKLIVVDGMERVQIARKHGLEAEVLEMEFPDRAAAKLWMSRNQIARRNLTKAQFDYHLGELYNAAKGEHGGLREMGAGSGRTRDKLAAEMGTAGGRVERAGMFAEAVDAAAAKAPEVREALNEGKRLSPAKLKAIAEAETDEEAKKLAAQAIGGADEKVDEPVEEPLVKDVKDAHGKPVTDHRFYSVFQDMHEFDRLAKELRKVEMGMLALLRTPAGANLNFDDVVKASFKHIHAELKNKKPSRVCTKCRGECEVEKGGKNIECSACVGLGFLDVQQVAMQG